MGYAEDTPRQGEQPWPDGPGNRAVSYFPVVAMRLTPPAMPVTINEPRGERKRTVVRVVLKTRHQWLWQWTVAR